MRSVGLRTLPAPDRLDVRWPNDRTCWVTDDGGPLSLRLADALRTWGWSVVVLRYPDALIPGSYDRPIPDGVAVATLDSLEPDVLNAHYGTLVQQYGSVGAFIHLHPRFSAADTLYDGRTRSLIKAVFLMASYLGPALTEAATDGRSLFTTVTRMDGAWGLVGDGDVDPALGGFSGLIKTLHLEWPGVFCRAIDLDPTYETGRALSAVLAELQDPNRRLVEVGWRAGQRVMLEAFEEG